MLRRNTTANYLGQGWAALMGLAFVPLYITYLGMEAYGLIGLYALLQSWLALLDMGMTPTLSREMARFTAGTHSPGSIRDLLRSLEWVAVAISVLVAAALALAAPLIATGWVRPGVLDTATVTGAFAIMGLVIAARFVEGLYRSCIVGLQRQVVLNALHAATATLRGAGAVAVLAFVSPTITAFFLWQLLITLASLCLLAAVTYSSLPDAGRPAKLSVEALRKVGRYAGGMMVITFLSVLLMQVDKLVLSRLLSLEDYGVYALAAVLAGGLFTLISPITQSWLPRLNKLQVEGDKVALAQTFHLGAQMASVVMGSAAVFLIAFAEPVLRLWLNDPDLARRAAPILRLLALGNLLNGLMWIPYQTQLAHGWTSLTIRLNSAAVAVVVPAILYVTPHYGAQGAAMIWAGLNAFYIIVGAQLMFRHIMQSEKLQWYLEDLGYPLLSSAFIAIVARSSFTDKTGALLQLGQLFAYASVILLAAMLSARMVRTKAIKIIRGCPR